MMRLRKNDWLPGLLPLRTRQLKTKQKRAWYGNINSRESESLDADTLVFIIMFIINRGESYIKLG
jgi:hypothetical protein